MASSRSGEASLLLLTALLAIFATAASAARPQPSLQSSAAARGLAKALGVSGYGHEEPCCMCECDLIWPPEKSYCSCGGVFDGSCPAACKRCFCIAGLCYCLERVKYKDCMMSLCPYYAFPAAAQAAAEQKQEN